MQAINSGANYTKGNPGYPIAFRVRHLVDGSVARTSQQCSYSETNWGLLMLKFRVSFNSIDLNKTYIPGSSSYIKPYYYLRIGNNYSDDYYYSYASDEEPDQTVYVGGSIGLGNRGTEVTLLMHKDTKLTISVYLQHFSDPFIGWDTYEDVGNVQRILDADDLLVVANWYTGLSYQSNLFTPASVQGENILHFTITKL